MILNYNYLDILFLIREVFFIGIVLFSICFYTGIESATRTLQSRVTLYYSVSLYFIGVLNIYLISCFSYVNRVYYLFNYSISNVNSIDNFKIILTLLFILVFYAGISDISFIKFKYIPFETAYILTFVFIGMIFLLYSNDFLFVFLNLELQNFSLYILMNLQRNKKIVVEACIKYYIIGVSLRLFCYTVFLFFTEFWVCNVL